MDIPFLARKLKEYSKTLYDNGSYLLGNSNSIWILHVIGQGCKFWRKETRNLFESMLRDGVR